MEMAKCLQLQTPLSANISQSKERKALQKQNHRNLLYSSLAFKLIFGEMMGRKTSANVRMHEGESAELGEKDGQIPWQLP